MDKKIKLKTLSGQKIAIGFLLFASAFSLLGTAVMMAIAPNPVIVSFISLIDPNKATIWRVGDTVQIKWNASAEVRYVAMTWTKINNTTNRIAGWITPPMTGVVNTGSYSWKIPSVEPNGYRWNNSLNKYDNPVTLKMESGSDYIIQIFNHDGLDHTSDPTGNTGALLPFVGSDYFNIIADKSFLDCPISYKLILVSQAHVGNFKDGSVSSPFNTLDEAKAAAQADSKLTSAAPGYCIFLNGGEVFTNFTSHKYENDAKSKYAFVWDLNKPLVMSSYGTGKAIIRQKDTSMPPSALLIVGPDTKTYNTEVKIQKLQFEKWQARVISIRYRSNVKIVNNVIDSVGTKFLGDEGTSGNGDSDRIYGDGIIYPKDSDNLIFDGNIMTNMINNTNGSDNKYDDVHAFYLTRVSNVTISNNTIKNTSGSAIKPSKGSSDIRILNNILSYVAPYVGQGSYDQLGFIRLDGDSGCPSNITAQNNIFNYPYCTGSSCSGNKKAQLCSQVHCSGSCSSNINWVNNTVNLNWQ
ncbi:MAG: right-handed parallel beta-helix repeat-containing protein [Patescibacteria group bacterium]